MQQAVVWVVSENRNTSAKKVVIPMAKKTETCRNLHDHHPSQIGRMLVGTNQTHGSRLEGRGHYGLPSQNRNGASLRALA